MPSCQLAQIQHAAASTVLSFRVQRRPTWAYFVRKRLLQTPAATAQADLQRQCKDLLSPHFRFTKGKRRVNYRDPKFNHAPIIREDKGGDNTIEKEGEIQDVPPSQIVKRTEAVAVRAGSVKADSKRQCKHPFQLAVRLPNSFHHGVVREEKGRDNTIEKEGEIQDVPPSHVIERIEAVTAKADSQRQCKRPFQHADGLIRSFCHGASREENGGMNTNKKRRTKRKSVVPPTQAVRRRRANSQRPSKASFGLTKHATYSIIRITKYFCHAAIRGKKGRINTGEKLRETQDIPRPQVVGKRQADSQLLCKHSLEPEFRLTKHLSLSAFRKHLLHVPPLHVFEEITENSRKKSRRQDILESPVIKRMQGRLRVRYRRQDVPLSPVTRRIQGRLRVKYRRRDAPPPQTARRRWMEGRPQRRLFSRNLSREYRDQPQVVRRRRRVEKGIPGIILSRNLSRKYRAPPLIYRTKQIRPKFVSLGFGLTTQPETDKMFDGQRYSDAYSKRWLIAFAGLSAPHDSQQGPGNTQLKEYSVPEGSIMQNWLEYSPRSLRHQRLMWEALMLKSLQTSHRDALMILTDCLKRNQFRPPGYQIEDSLDLITCKTLLNCEVPDSRDVEAILECVQMFFRKYKTSSGRSSISQRTIFLLSNFLSKYRTIDDLSSFHDLLREQNVTLHFNSKLHAITRFIGFKDIRSAWKILQTLSPSEFSSNQVQSICVRLLRVNLDVENIYTIRSDMLAQMLQMGLRPNRHIYSAILLNAMEAGDRDTGWRIYQVARNNGLKANIYTYTILLKGASDMASIEAVRSSALNDGIEIHHPRFATEILQSIYRSEESTSENWAFTAMLPHYQEYFSTQPLKDLGMLEYAEEASAADNKMQPSQFDLFLLILTYIKQYGKTDRLLSLYDNYRHLVRTQHPVISLLAKSTHTANALLKAFGRGPRTLPLGISVIEEVMKSNVPDESLESSPPENDSDVNSKQNLVAPDVQTWSILVRSFLRVRQPAAAEKVVKIMQDRRVSPNHVTWNTLISGYSNMQNANAAVDSLQRMERDGFQPDDRTLGGLGRIKSRQKLIEAFERALKDEPKEDQRAED